MSRVRLIVPDFYTLLCETCGYNLTGLSREGRCPECGQPIAESMPEHRRPAPLEQKDSVGSYLATCTAVMFHPARFFRGLSVSHYGNTDRFFGRFNWDIAAALLGSAAYVHLNRLFGWDLVCGGPFTGIPCWAVTIYFLIVGVTHLAVWLTAWEAAFRGLRLPRWLVLRGMHFHSAHYTPVAIVVLTTVVGYQMGISFGWFDVTYGPYYVVILGVEMLLAAWYLFRTYLIAMRNLMYANGRAPLLLPPLNPDE